MDYRLANKKRQERRYRIAFAQIVLAPAVALDASQRTTDACMLRAGQLLAKVACFLHQVTGTKVLFFTFCPNYQHESASWPLPTSSTRWLSIPLAGKHAS